jgi:hypothetical protein
MRHSHISLTIILAMTAVSGNLSAKSKHPKAATPQPPDQIAIEAHIANGDGPITRFVATRHYDHPYVYAERGAGKPVTLIDVANPSHPEVLSNVNWPGSSGNLLAVAGTSALASDGPGEKAPSLQTIRLMDFSDPADPKVKKQFDGVTAVEKIGGGIILLANADGIWILSQHFAEDPEVQKRYANMVVYQ